MYLLGSLKKHKNSSKHSIKKFQGIVSFKGGFEKNSHFINIFCDTHLLQDENNEF